MQDDEEYVPVSARIPFRLQVAKEAEDSHEYIALQQGTAQFIKGMRLELKKCVIACAKIELHAIQEQRSRHLCEAMYATCNIFHVAQGIPKRDVYWTVKSILEKHGDSILKSFNESTEDFIKLYVLTTGATLNQNDEPDYEYPVKIHCTFETVFVSTSWDKYLRQTETNEISLTVKKRVKETLLAKKTANDAYLSNSFNWHFDNPNDTEANNNHIVVASIVLNMLEHVVLEDMSLYAKFDLNPSRLRFSAIAMKRRICGDKMRQSTVASEMIDPTY